MISFIQRDDDPEIPPPYKFPGITIMSFRLQADLGKSPGALRRVAQYRIVGGPRFRVPCVHRFRRHGDRDLSQNGVRRGALFAVGDTPPSRNSIFGSTSGNSTLFGGLLFPDLLTGIVLSVHLRGQFLVDDKRTQCDRLSKSHGAIFSHAGPGRQSPSRSKYRRWRWTSIRRRPN